MDFLNENAVQIFKIVTGIVGVFALIATMTPNTVDNKIAQFVMDLVNFLGANVGKAANDGDINRGRRGVTK